MAKRNTEVITHVAPVKAIDDSVLNGFKEVLQKIIQTCDTITKNVEVNYSTSIDVNEFYKLVMAFATLGKAVITVDQREHQKARVYQETAEMIKEEVRRRMSAHPELVAQIQAIISDVEFSVKELET